MHMRLKFTWKKRERKQSMLRWTKELKTIEQKYIMCCLRALV